MSYILQVDFHYSGPWGKAMSEGMEGLAHSIAEEPGLLWKIWTENEAAGEAGGIYLFRDIIEPNRLLVRQRSSQARSLRIGTIR